MQPVREKLINKENAFIHI